MRKIPLVLLALFAFVLSAPTRAQEDAPPCQAKVSYIHVSNDPCYSFLVSVRRKLNGACATNVPCTFEVRVRIGQNASVCRPLEDQDAVTTPQGTIVDGPYPIPTPSTMVLTAALRCGTSLRRDIRMQGATTSLAILKLECTPCPQEH